MRGALIVLSLLLLAVSPGASAKQAATDWTRTVAETPEGGFRMGNPDARVKLIEFGSMTCPHCAAFDEAGGDKLVDGYVKSGQLSWEFRNFVRDDFDIAAALIARCNGARTFFPLTRALFKDQPNWIERIEGAPQQELGHLGALPPNREFAEIGKIAGFPQWAAKRGLPPAKSALCLSKEISINRLKQMHDDTIAQYPEFQGTPQFIINGQMLTYTATWDKLEPQLKAALGERG